MANTTDDLFFENQHACASKSFLRRVPIVAVYAGSVAKLYTKVATLDANVDIVEVWKKEHEHCTIRCGHNGSDVIYISQHMLSQIGYIKLEAEEALLFEWDGNRIELKWSVMNNPQDVERLNRDYDELVKSWKSEVLMYSMGLLSFS